MLSEANDDDEEDDDYDDIPPPSGLWTVGVQPH